jgi:membrane dipeptidase
VPTPIVDAHLDLAWNARKGRDLDLTAAELRERPGMDGAMVTLPELQRGGVGVVFATLYVGTGSYDDEGNGIYEVAPDVDARQQLEIYRRWEADGKVRIVTDRTSLGSHLDAWANDRTPGLVLLIEGGDSIASPAHLQEWWDAGVRVIGPAWSRTRYCGGTRAPGGLTDLGRELLAGMTDLGVILDVAHMAEQSFWDAFDVGFHRVVATHCNVRSFVNETIADRHLSDDMLNALGKADAVVGVVPYNGFLLADKPEGDVHLDVVAKHLEHMASIVGWDHVGIGSDLDGGFGSEATPLELDTSADLHRIGDLVPADAREGVLGANWLRVLAESLP